MGNQGMEALSVNMDAVLLGSILMLHHRFKTGNWFDGERLCHGKAGFLLLLYGFTSSRGKGWAGGREGVHPTLRG